MNESKSIKTGTRKGDTAELAAQLAPLEEQRAGIKEGEQNGVILVSSRDSKIPSSFTDEDPDAAGAFRIDNVVIFVLLVALAFIAFIAYLISQMPPEPK